jgi:hypothetical protein
MNLITTLNMHEIIPNLNHTRLLADYVGIVKYTDLYIQFERNQNAEIAIKKWRERKL